MEDKITISKKEYDQLVESANFLQCLEDAGVDNWEGIDYAQELMRQLEQDLAKDK